MNEQPQLQRRSTTSNLVAEPQNPPRKSRSNTFDNVLRDQGARSNSTNPLNSPSSIDDPDPDTPGAAAIAANSQMPGGKYVKIVKKIVGVKKRPPGREQLTPKSAPTTSPPTPPSPSSSTNRRRSYVKGPQIDRNHEQYALAISMMLGLRTVLAKTQQVEQNARTKKSLDDSQHSSMSTSTATSSAPTTIPLLLPKKHFKSITNLPFPPRGSLDTPPHKLAHTFKFKAYAPLPFLQVSPHSVFACLDEDESASHY